MRHATVGRPLAGAAFLLLQAFSGAACAAEPWLRPSQLPDRINEVSVLKALSVAQSEVVFRGEAAQHAWSVTFGRDEAGRPSRFQFGVLNAGSVLPEHSRLTLSINDRNLTEIAVDFAGTPSIVSVPVPPGLLVAGLNTVTIATSLAASAACSSVDSCGLWVRLQPASTGFVLKAGSAPYVPPIDDLASKPIVPAVDPQARTPEAPTPAALGGSLSAPALRRSIDESADPAPGPSRVLHSNAGVLGGIAMLVLLAALGATTPNLVRFAGVRP